MKEAAAEVVADDKKAATKPQKEEVKEAGAATPAKDAAVKPQAAAQTETKESDKKAEVVADDESFVQL